MLVKQTGICFLSEESMMISNKDNHQCKHEKRILEYDNKKTYGLNMAFLMLLERRDILKID